MPPKILRPRKFAYMGLEGVGAYGTGAPPLLAADIRRCREANINDVPDFQPRQDKTHNRPGTGLVKFGNSTDWNITAWVQTFTVDNPADLGGRPEQHRLLRMLGYIETWVDGGGGLYILRYQLQDSYDLMDSGIIQIDPLLSDATGVNRKFLKGCRGTATWRYTPGQPVQLEGVGKGVGYIEPTAAAVAAGVTLNISDPEIRFQEEGVVTISNPVAGGKVYDGPISLMEFDTLMNIAETPGGDLSGVAEITAVPTDEQAFRLQIDEQAVADYNAENELNKGNFIQVDTVMPTAVATNTFAHLFQGQIQSVDRVDVGGRGMFTLNCLTAYQDTTVTIEPGQTPVLSPVIEYRTQI